MTTITENTTIKKTPAKKTPAKKGKDISSMLDKGFTEEALEATEEQERTGVYQYKVIEKINTLKDEIKTLEDYINVFFEKKKLSDLINKKENRI